MSTQQALQSAPNGTVWSRKVGGVTYFLSKIGNSYQVWTSQASGSKSPVTLSQAVTYSDQYNLIPGSTPTPSPTTATPPAPSPKPQPKQTITVSNVTPPATTSFASSTTVDSLLGPEPFVPGVKSSSTITVDPTKLANASLNDDQSIRTNPTRLANTSLTDPLKDNQAIIVDPAKLPPTETAAIANLAPPSGTGLTASSQTAASAATAQDQANFEGFEDWRVRLSLAPNANYLYKAKPPGILQPLVATNGVVFPYTPSITITYAAQYEPTVITHSNYKVQQYQHSGIDQIQIIGEFTAQDVHEANYVLAVVHFFRSMTKMFYGKDSDPKRGTPPPLCYIFGMGGYQFDALPMAIASFNYSLPNDVDYIKTTGASPAGSTQPSLLNFLTGLGSPSQLRLGKDIKSGGKPPPPDYSATPTSVGVTPTWVPSKIQMSISCVPIMSRNQVSNYFSLQDYATGNLLKGTERQGGGFW